MPPSPTAFAFAAAVLAAAAGAAEPPRDPFTPWQPAIVSAGSGPLQRYPLEALKLRGVVAATASPRALVEAPDGASHLARVGDGIGTSFGRIAAIRPDALVVVERYRDAIGGMHERRAELRLHPAEVTAAPAVQAP
jgi:Tfp pilus assembly protein PilP